MNKTALGCAILAIASSAAMADTSLSINIELDDAVLTTATYDCGTEEALQVQYIVSEGDILALVPVDGDARVFVNVVAGSGSRYVAGQYEWWSKGQDATLRDLIDDRIVLECSARD